MFDLIKRCLWAKFPINQLETIMPELRTINIQVWDLNNVNTNNPAIKNLN